MHAQYFLKKRGIKLSFSHSNGLRFYSADTTHLTVVLLKLKTLDADLCVLPAYTNSMTFCLRSKLYSLICFYFEYTAACIK